MPGWFKIDRDLLEHDIWLGEEFSRGQAWVDLIGLASFKAGSFRKHGVKIEYERGDVTTSVLGLADRWGWKSRGKVERFLAELEAEDRITNNKIGRLTSLISITNYDKYQLDGHQTDIKRTSNGHQTDILEEGKEGKEVNNNNKARPKNLEQVVGYFLDKGYDQDEAERFYNRNEAVGWIYGQTKQPVKDWKAAARNWMKKSDEFKKRDNDKRNTGKKSPGQAIIDW